MANLGVLEKFGVKFIDSKLKKTSYAIDDEKKGLVIIKDGIKTPKKNLPRGYENGKWQNFIEAARAQTGLPVFKKGKEWKKYCEQKKIKAN